MQKLHQGLVWDCLQVPPPLLSAWSCPVAPSPREKRLDGNDTEHINPRSVHLLYCLQGHFDLIGGGFLQSSLQGFGCTSQATRNAVGHHLQRQLMYLGQRQLKVVVCVEVLHHARNFFVGRRTVHARLIRLQATTLRSKNLALVSVLVTCAYYVSSVHRFSTPKHMGLSNTSEDVCTMKKQRRADRQTGRQTDKHKDTHTHTETERERERDTHTHTHTHPASQPASQTDRQTGRHTDTHSRLRGLPTHVGDGRSPSTQSSVYAQPQGLKWPKMRTS